MNKNYHSPDSANIQSQNKSVENAFKSEGKVINYA